MQNVDTQQAKFEKTLSLREKKSSLTAKCCLKGFWFDTDVHPGNVVSVQGVWDEDRRLFMITTDAGLIVTSPDTLISGTSVVGSMFCPRKSVLGERFRPIEMGEVTNVSPMTNKVCRFSLKSQLF